MTVKKPRRRIASAENTFDIIECLKRMDGATAQELSHQVDLTASTIHEYLATLKYHGYVMKRDGVYHLSYQFLTLGGYVRDNDLMYNISREWIRKLVKETDELCSISIEERGKRIALHLENDHYNIRNTHPLGKEFYLHTNAAGKAILAKLSDERIKEIIEEYGLPEQTANTITDQDRLFEEIAEIREQNYALNLEERREDWHAVASGIEISKSDTVGAISIAGPPTRLSREKLENEFASTLLKVKNEIELEIQFTNE